MKYKLLIALTALCLFGCNERKKFFDLTTSTTVVQEQPQEVDAEVFLPPAGSTVKVTVDGVVVDGVVVPSGQSTQLIGEITEITDDFFTICFAQEADSDEVQVMNTSSEEPQPQPDPVIVCVRIKYNQVLDLEILSLPDEFNDMDDMNEDDYTDEEKDYAKRRCNYINNLIHLKFFLWARRIFVRKGFIQFFINRRRIRILLVLKYLFKG